MTTTDIFKPVEYCINHENCTGQQGGECEVHAAVLVPDASTITTAADAQQTAIDWQNWQSEQALSIGELAKWHGFFEALAVKFPELADEFKENAII
jgi:hypothetical protein